MKLFYALLLCIILVLTVITISLRSDSTSFYGIADAQEITVNDEFAVEISRIFITPGQRVRAGDTLIEVKRPELDLKIAELRTEVLRNKSEKDVLVNELKGEIREIEAQLETNKKLVSELRSIKKGELDDAGGNFASPAEERLIQLKQALQLAINRPNSGDEVRSNRTASVKELQNELNMLMEVKRNPYKTSQITGLVGVVNFREGEIVSPFVPICSLHTESPSFIRGYIHENIYSSISVGQKVQVASVANKNIAIGGEVTGVGVRIVEYPVRLRKSPEVLMWGREVIIKIPVSNHFLLGEKVLISIADVNRRLFSFPALSLLPIVKTCAAETRGPGGEYREIRHATKGNGAPRIEASGLLYLADLDRYLLASDETPGKKPSLFIITTGGLIEKEAVIEGLDEIDDIEALSADNRGNVYVLASQSYNKKGRLPASRKRFVRVKRNGALLTLSGSVPLRDILESAAIKTPGEHWAALVLGGIKDSTLDIESVACSNDEILIGLKSPLKNDSVIIITMGNADLLFSASPSPKVSLAKSLLLPDPATASPGRLSDLLCHGGTLYMLSVAKANSGTGHGTDGALWRQRPDDARPLCIGHFPGRKPEGIAYNPSTGELFVAFDNGPDKSSELLTVKVEQ